MKSYEFEKYLTQGHWKDIPCCDYSEFSILVDMESKQKRIMVIDHNKAHLIDADRGVIREYELAKCHTEPDALGIMALIEEEE